MMIILILQKGIFLIFLKIFANKFKFKNRIPPYGSAIFFELHIDDNGKYFVRFFYKKGFDGEYTQLIFKTLASKK
jgi:hypothetical protein